jgi:hypothetical protein
MPYPNEHACRLKDPTLFVRILELWDAKGARGIGGPLKSDPSGGTVTQSIHYRRREWTAAEAAADCRSKGGSFEAAEPTSQEIESASKADYLDPKQNPIIKTEEDK